jgi:hypothetical protein
MKRCATEALTAGRSGRGTFVPRKCRFVRASFRLCRSYTGKDDLMFTTAQSQGFYYRCLVLGYNVRAVYLGHLYDVQYGLL